MTEKACPSPQGRGEVLGLCLSVMIGTVRLLFKARQKTLCNDR
jgi:hypothetical protein